MFVPVEITLREHFKAYQLADILRISVSEAIGLVVCLWMWALTNAPEGDLSRHPPKVIANACHWRKKPEDLINALQQCKFLTSDMRIHDWDDYLGKLLEQREANKIRNRESRAKKKVAELEMKKKLIALEAELAKHHEHITSASRDGAIEHNSTEHNTNEEDSTKEDTRIAGANNLESLFDLFWAAYPKKVAKAKAVQAFEKLKPDKGLLDQMLSAITKQKKSEAWTRDSGRFIPNPATWLTQERWEDEVIVSAAPGKRLNFQDYDQSGQSEDYTTAQIGPNLLAEAQALAKDSE